MRYSRRLDIQHKHRSGNVRRAAPGLRASGGPRVVSAPEGERRQKMTLRFVCLFARLAVRGQTWKSEKDPSQRPGRGDMRALSGGSVDEEHLKVVNVGLCGENPLFLRSIN